MGALRCGSRLKPPAPAWQGRPSPTRPIRKGCSEEANNRRHGGGNRPSGNDVGRQLVLEPRELVAQQQLAFLEPLDLELVGLARRALNAPVAARSPDAKPLRWGRRTRPNLPPKCRGRERVFHRPALSWR